MRFFDPRLRLRHLQCLIALASHRSVLKAADALALTPSAVSKSLSELEGITGEILFMRYRKGLELTAPGQTLLRHAAQAMGTLQDGFDRIGTGTKAPEHLRIGVLPTAETALVPLSIVDLQARYPDILVTAHNGANPELLMRLRLGELDLVLGRIAEPSQMVGIAFEHLYTELMVLTVRAGHPLVDPAKGAPDEAAQGSRAPDLTDLLASYPMVLPTPGTFIRAAADTFFTSHGIARSARCTETLSSSVARTLMLESDAIWFSPEGIVAGDVAAKIAAVLPIDTRGTAASVGLSTMGATPPGPATQAFMDIVRQHAAGRTAH